MDLRLLLSFNGGLTPPADALGTKAFHFSSKGDFQSVLAGEIAVAINVSVVVHFLSGTYEEEEYGIAALWLVDGQQL